MKLCLRSLRSEGDVCVCVCVWQKKKKCNQGGPKEPMETN